MEHIFNRFNLKKVIHGHIHNKNISLENHFNVSVENIDYAPINLKNIERM